MIQDLRLCYNEFCLAYPYLLILYIIIVLLLIVIVRTDFMRFKTAMEKEHYRAERKSLRIFFMIMRPIVLLLLFIAIASPFTQQEIVVQGDPSLKILVDNSTSMGMFEGNIAKNLAAGLKGELPVKLRTIASGLSSPIGDGILNHMQGDDHLLVVSDGNNNNGRVLGDVLLFASKLNTTVHTLDISPIKEDAAVILDGPSEVIIGEETEFLVDVRTVSELDYTLEVDIDGEKIIEEKNGKSQNFKKRFSEGYHKITAKITLDDYFDNNNVFYKTIKVLPKPKLLFVSEKASVLFRAMEDIYEIDTKNFIPANLDEYSAVVINDIAGNKLKDKTELLSSYVADGNGLVVVGGQDSYDRGFYQKLDYGIEPLLPVRIGKSETEQQNKVNIILLIDVSESGGGVGWGQSNRLDVSKALAVKILSDIRPDDNVGVIAFHSHSVSVSHLRPLVDTPEIYDAIARLIPGGGTNIYSGLARAENEMMSANGNKNIILISDGYTVYEQLALTKAKALAESGIKVYPVGVGEGVVYPTNFEFMKKLASLGNGVYFKPSETEYLKILFGRSEETASDKMSLVVLDRDHWITKAGINLVAKVSGLNYVTPKLGAKTLVATNEGDPILTAGRYGLGRVVALSTDDGGKWAGEMLKKENSKLLVRAINWAIGNPARNRDFDVTIKDTELGEQAKINIISDKTPTSETLSFSKVGKRLYTSSHTPKKTGFFEVLGAVFAVNYPKEYKELGMNNNFKAMVQLTGGSVFDPADTASIAQKIREMSKRIKVDVVYYRWPFILAAIILFLVEIAIRRYKENKTPA